MSINQRQFEQLTEMGISLWQHKSATFTQTTSAKSNLIQEKQYLSQAPEDLETLSKQTIFTDILLCLELSVGEVLAKKDHLDLGLFNWYFSSNTEKEDPIYCTENNLVSPSIALVSQSSALKKQLWQTIIKNLL